MDSSELCVFCNTNSDQKVIIFTEKILTKSKDTLKLRIQYGLKYHEVVLPAELTDNHGYHSRCYKFFSAVQKKYHNKSLQTSKSLNQVKTEIQDNSIDNLSQDASETTDDTVDSPQATMKNCIFCEKKPKKHRGRWQTLNVCNPSVQSNIKLFASKKCDTKTLQKINDAKEIYYHPVCKQAYQNSTRTKPQQTSWHYMRDFHKLAYYELCAYIENKIVENKKSIFLELLCSIYQNILIEISKEKIGTDDFTCSRQYLEEKITQTFKKKIKIVFMHKKKIVVPVDNIPAENAFQSLEEDDLLQRAALIVREKLLNSEKNKLPENLTITDIIDGECSIPEPLNDFYSILLGGSFQRQRQSLNCIRKVKSLSQDAIYAVNNEEIKTSKHMVMGIALKNLTNNEKVIDILNGYGHCCSYNVIEELESQLSSTERSEICADSILLESNLSTGVRLNNLEKYVEQGHGKETLLDNYSIFIKSEPPNIEIANELSSEISQDENIEVFLDTTEIQNNPLPDNQNVVMFTGVRKQEDLEISEDQNMEMYIENSKEEYADETISEKGMKRSFDTDVPETSTMYLKRNKNEGIVINNY